MAIYRTGQASMDAQGYITGYGTKWREQLTLIRAGATIMFLTNPVKLGVITEVVSDTSIRAITTGGAVVARTDYVILLHDSLTVDGLAQDVAETLRYYQGKETEFAHFIEFLETFDFAKLEDLTNQTKDAAAKAKISETNAKASENAALASKNAAKTSETNAKASETAANNSKNAAKTSETNAKASETNAASSKTAAANSATAARASQDAAKVSETNAESSKTAAASSASAAKTSETNAANSKNAAASSASAAKTSETNAANSKTAAASSASAAKTSETNAKASENKAKEYMETAQGIASPLIQYRWPVGTAAEEKYIKIAKLSDPGSSECHVTLMITNGGNYGSRFGSIDFLDASARGLGNTTITASNVRQFMQIRRLGDPNLAEDNQMRYGLVKGDGFFEIWAYQRAFINNVKVAILAKTGWVDLYVPTGAVIQAEAPDGWVKSVAIRVYDEVNKPSRSDLGLANVMEIGDFGLGGSGISHNDITSNADLMQRMKEKGGHFWRSSQKSGTTSSVMSHGSGIFSRCGDTNSAINIDYNSGKVVILAANDSSLAAGNVKVNTLYGTANKPSKSDVGLGNVTNDAQVRKVGDTMTGDLDIAKGTPSIRLKSASGNAHLWFMNADGTERGVIWSPENNASLGEIRIRAKTTGGTTGGDVVIRHDGRLEAKDVKAAYRVSGQSLALANTDTNAAASTIAVSGKQHTPIMLTRDADSNVSIGFKLNNMNQKMLGVDIDGDIAFGESADHRQNSKLITKKMLDAGFSVAGLMSFTNGFAGAWEAKNIADQRLDLNSLMIKKSDPGTVYVYQCPSAGGGSNITNKPGGVAGNFILYVESIRKVSDTDFTNRQRLFGTESNREFTRTCNNGTWSAWRETVVSGMNQDVSVNALSASGRLSGGELAVGGAGALNGNLGVGGGAASKVPGSDKGIVIGRGAMVREGGEGRLILSASGGTDRQVQLRPAGAAASDNGIEISCTSASGGDTKIAFGQGAAFRCNTSGSPIISAKAGQMMYLRPNGDANGAGQVTIAGSGNVTVDGVVESKGLTAMSGQITTNDGGIELYHASPYVDFHFNKSSADYTARIINDAADQLTFDCRSVRTLNDFTARGLIRACHNDAFVAWPIEDPTGGNGAILKAPSFISRFNAIGNAARCAMWLEEHRGYEHRAVIEVSKWGDSGATQYWQFKANGKISSTAHGDVVFAGLSDINYKENVVDYDGRESLENINAMNLVKFTYKDDERKRERRGVIAQQVREIDPCYVKESDASYQDENGNVVENKRLVLDTNPLLMDALCAIKALSAQVDELKEEIRKLKGE
nr:MAG TPA: tail protein [Caudoviricetes sp.]